MPRPTGDVKTGTWSLWQRSSGWVQNFENSNNVDVRLSYLLLGEFIDFKIRLKKPRQSSRFRPLETKSKIKLRKRCQTKCQIQHCYPSKTAWIHSPRASNWISNCFPDSSWRFWVNSHRSEIGRFSAQSLRYGPYSKTLIKIFLSRCGTICVDFGWIRKGRNVCRFWAKTLGYSPWFWTWSISVSPANRPNSLKCLLNPSKITSKSLRHCLCRFLVNSQGSKCGHFLAKTLGYSPWFWTWSILVSSGNRSKISLKRLLNHSKMISKSLRDCLCRFRVNSQGSKFGRFWAKTLGYSPWFWRWSILVSPGNRCKLSEIPPKHF